ncbi:NAD(P)H-binding protein [Winogradskyella rapida]|uniref:NAD(P)H-binding protein n=1 Tax=Winogradskyella rapida TaxID=549701 RepID=A0ABW3KMN6_9FLAO
MGKIAIILGATGLTGSQLLQQLINDPRYATIKLFSRSKVTSVTSPKVEQYIGDLLNLEQFRSDFTGDEVYCCIGTTKSKTPDKDQYKKIDFGIPVSAAKLAKENGIRSYAVVSAMGANANSAIFYNKVKGEMEAAVLAQNLDHTFILRPSLIGGDRDEARALEKFGLSLFKLISPLLIGPLKKYRIVEAEAIANAMVYMSNSSPAKNVIIKSDEINAIHKHN